ncbi:ATP-dependent RecD-like DNA helicase [Kiritimatiella glycovorans]|uniref:Helicase RecD/TraA n=1 Tax=Kiritimatiella glycovorans TaxID=1307763 RepID=A0A0G3ECW0_9BACT|nr:ATP-dependent RecD-like DNA helicase [Kiritimatiella glycovorans]AKJ64158.1 Helicase RecD/TraA [Kiritimatiella glycovorans]
MKKNTERRGGSDGDGAISGQVELVTYRNEDNGFSVLKVKVRGHRDLVAVVGTASAVNPGEWLSAEGEWVRDPKFGRQFKAREIRTAAPDTLEGIERYLGSGLIKGIGPEYASRLVKVFGRDVFDVIENASARLERVEGIGTVRRKRIKDAWEEQKVVREIMTFLFSHGVGTSRAYRIYKTYGDRAIETLQRDPYCLARDIRGIGFRTADLIGERLGVKKDSMLRARAGVEYVLSEWTGQGHCACPVEQLVADAERILEIDDDRIRRAIDEGISNERLMREPGPLDSDLIFLPPLYHAERHIARRFRALMSTGHPMPPIDVAKAIEWVEKKLKLTLSDSQREALGITASSAVSVLTGGPGVGKTTLVRALVRIFTAKRLRVVLCAPTGRAAKRLSESGGLEARTLHRLMEFDPGSGRFRHGRDAPLEGDVFIVDESSMLDAVLAAQFTDALPDRAAVIWVGDKDQLPSVGPGSFLRDVIRSNVIPVAGLTTVFRQAAQSGIVTNAHRINEGAAPDFPGDSGDGDCFFIQAEEPEKGADLIRKLVRESVPRRFRLDPVRDIQVLAPMMRGELGVRHLNDVLQSALNPKGEEVERFGTVFRVGDRVMQTENDYDKNVFNGDIGWIRSIDAEERELTVEFDGRRVKYEWQELDELQLSYAVTIHKSQGSEYPCVIIPVHTQHYVMLQRNLIYTALTRARTLAIFVGTRKALGIAVKRAEARERITMLRQRLQDELRP